MFEVFSVAENRNMVPEMKAESWKDRWKLYLGGGVSAEDIVDEAIAEYVEILTTNMASYGPAVNDVNKPMIGFCKKAREDLVRLAKVGANPAIILRLANPAIMNAALDQKDENEERNYEFEMIAKPDYWKRMVSKLRGASDTLREFMDLQVYKDIEEQQMGDALERRIYPFVSVCEEVRATEKVIDRLVRRIEKLRLDKGSRKMTYNPPYVWLEPIEATRGPKPGLDRRLDWDRAAYALWRYMVVRTKKPRFRRIARLLHFAGWDFPGVITSSEDPAPSSEHVAQDEVDKLWKRVQKLGKDPSVSRIGDLITRLDLMYETRGLEDYGGFSTSSFSATEPETNSNE